MSEIGCYNMCHDCAYLQYDEVYSEEADDWGWAHNCLKDVPNDKVENCSLFEFDSKEAEEAREILLDADREAIRKRLYYDQEYDRMSYIHKAVEYYKFVLRLNLEWWQ